MNYRNCFSADLYMLLLYLLLNTNTQADSRSLERTKRLTSPVKDEQTMELAKYVVSVRSNRPQIIFGDNHFCVGSIVAPRFVLTAAKCTMSKYKVKHLTRSMVVVGGTPNRLIHVADSVTKSVKKIFVPDNFTQHSKNNIALLLLYGSWPTDNPSIDIIRLPDEEPNYGVQYMVLGWGRMYKGGPLTGNLVHIFVKLLDRNTCLAMVKDLYPEMLCAGNFGGELDYNPCAGDTGAPMIMNHTLIGIVSHRLGCGTNYMPSLYTDVFYHMDWINETLKNSASQMVTLFLFSWISLLVLVA